MWNWISDESISWNAYIGYVNLMVFEKATKNNVKTIREISSNFVSFSEYMN